MKITRPSLRIFNTLLCAASLVTHGVHAQQAEQYIKRFEAFKAKAEQGDANAQYNLGVCYRSDPVVKQNYAEAVNWFRAAAQQNHAAAQCDLGTCYYSGTGVTKDKAEGVKWVRKAAEQNYAPAQQILGDFYYSGNEALAYDYAEAVKWYRKAAEQNFLGGHFKLGICYENGHGVKADYAEAYAWYYMTDGLPQGTTKRKNLENRMSPQELEAGKKRAKELESRISPKPPRRDPLELKALAEKGNAEAQHEFGNTYLASDRGGGRNLVEAYAWNDLAAKTSRNAAETKALLELMMEPEQVVTAQKRTKELRAQIDAKLQAQGDKANVIAEEPASAVTSSVTKTATVGMFTVKVPTEWKSYFPDESAALRRQYLEQSKQIYQQFSRADDPAKSVDIAAFHILNEGGSFVIVSFTVPPQADLITLLRSQVRDKMDWGVREGHIRSYLGLVSVGDENFSGFYTKAIGKGGGVQVSGGLEHKKLKNTIVQLTLLCPREWDEAKATNTLSAVLKSIVLKGK